MTYQIRRHREVDLNNRDIKGSCDGVQSREIDTGRQRREETRQRARGYDGPFLVDGKHRVLLLDIVRGSNGQLFIIIRALGGVFWVVDKGHFPMGFQ